ncbi:hypothetical protein GcC1_056006 [Golovinomyces cichoracearum]|uniref:Uncharacterized protein n=1 Tax=Golovinomyces cichoracearum TaxID=62708 RepID=A0A420IUW5_9PEZI|nr:hypothetical protein GcC1_056006 [Golovinomyces cichoracearum]
MSLTQTVGGNNNCWPSAPTHPNTKYLSVLRCEMKERPPKRDDLFDMLLP